MIDVRDISTTEGRIGWSIFCPECEKELGTQVSIRVPFRSPKEKRYENARVKRFEKTHSQCVDKELESRVRALYGKDFAKKSEIVERLYAENPEIKFCEVQAVLQKEMGLP